MESIATATRAADVPIGSAHLGLNEAGLQVDSKVGTRQESSVAGLRSQLYETRKVRSGGQGRNRTADASLFRAV
jgi:hypothetical protein